MQDVTLEAKSRQQLGKAAASVRADGLIPGVVYGQGEEATPVAIEAQAVTKAFQVAGTNRLIELTIEGVKTPVNTLFVEVQNDPVTGEMIHFDLYTVRMDEEIETEIPIHFEGTAPATYQLDGVLVKNLEEIEVKALPNKLPESFVVDLEGLAEINAAIHVSDLAVPDGVEIMTEAEELIVKVDPPRSEEELEELDEEIAADAEEQVASEHGSAESDEEGGDEAKDE